MYDDISLVEVFRNDREMYDLISYIVEFGVRGSVSMIEKYAQPVVLTKPIFRSLDIAVPDVRSLRGAEKNPSNETNHV